MSKEIDEQKKKRTVGHLTETGKKGLQKLF